MKNRNIPYYVAALMLAAGVSTSFVSCVDTEEPDSIVTLRNAKAEEVKAEAEYQKALAAVQNAEAELLIAKKSIEAANAKKVEYEAEYVNLKNAHEKAVWAAEEAEKAIELANKQAVSETQKQLAIADVKLQLETKNKELADAVNATAVAAAGYANAIAEATKDAEIAARKMNLYGTKTNDYTKDVEDYISAGRTLTKALNKLNTALTVLKGDQAVLEADVTEGKELLQEAKDAKQAFIDQMKDADVTKWVELYRAQETIIDNETPDKNQAQLDLNKKNEEKAQKYDRPLEKLENAETEAKFVLKTTLEEIQDKIAEDFENQLDQVEFKVADDGKTTTGFKLDVNNEVLEAYLSDQFGEDGEFKIEDGKIIANTDVEHYKWTNKTFFEGEPEVDEEGKVQYDADGKVKIKDESPLVELKAILDAVENKFDKDYWTMSVKYRQANQALKDDDPLNYLVKDAAEFTEYPYRGTVTAAQAKAKKKEWEDAKRAISGKTGAAYQEAVVTLRTAAIAYFGPYGVVKVGKVDCPLLEEPTSTTGKFKILDGYKESYYTNFDEDNFETKFKDSYWYAYRTTLLDKANDANTDGVDQFELAKKLSTGLDGEGKAVTDGNNIPAIVKAFEDAYAKVQKEAKEAEYEFKYKANADEDAEDKFVKAEDGTTEVKIKLADAQKAADDATAEVDKFEANNKTYKEEADKKIAELEDALEESNEVKMARVIKGTIEGAFTGDTYEGDATVYNLKVDKPTKNDNGEWDTEEKEFTLSLPTEGTITEAYDAVYESIIDAYDELIEDIEEQLADVEENLANFKSAVAAGKDGKFGRITVLESDGQTVIDGYEDLKDHLDAVKDIINGKQGVNGGKSLEGLQEAYDDAKQKYEDDMALLNDPKDDTTSK